MPDQPFDFYGWILPPGNNYYAAFTRLSPNNPNPRAKDGRWVNHAVFNSLDSLEAWAAGRSESTEASYFALAAFTANGPPRKDKFGREHAVAIRKQENVQAIKSLWADIDCGGPDKQYMTKADALAALNGHIDAGNLLPPSIIVDSGNGYHLYWCMEKGLPEKAWKSHALRLRNHLSEIGLRIDGGCTIDSARVLRCPNTLNCKDPSNPKDVHIVEYSETYEWEPFLASLRALENATGDEGEGTLDISQLAPLAAAVAAAEGTGNTALSAGVTAPSQSEMAVIATKCHQIGEMLSNNGATCDEPLWKAMLLLAGACADGEAMAHTLSSGHKDYDQQRTQAKFEEQRAKLADQTAGPSRCATFFNLRPEGCAGCPNNDLRVAERPGYPWRLGFETQQLGFLPNGYRITADKAMEKLVVERDEDGNVTKTWVRFAPFAVQDFALRKDTTENVYVFSLVRRGKKPHRVEINASTLFGTVAAARVAMAKAGMEIQGQKETEYMSTLLKSFAEELEQANGAVSTLDTVAGFLDANTFQLGSRRITAEGVTRVPHVIRENISTFEPKGSYDAWKAVQAPLAASSPAVQTIVALSFGAVLAKLIDFNGFLFSFYSRESGTGKTTGINVGASIFGNPRDLVASFNDTEKSVAFRIAQHPNMPAYWDEFRSVSGDKELAGRVAMLFSLAQGKERSRLTADVQMRYGGAWNTLMGVGTNEKLSELAARGSANSADPISARMLEIAMPITFDTSVVASKPFTEAINNYGWAGEPFLQKVLADRASIVANIEVLADKLRIDTGLLTGEFRFKHRACALVLVGAALAKQLGIIDFDLMGIKKLLMHSMLSASVQDAIVSKSISDTTSTVLGWFTSAPGSWLLMDGTTVHMNPDVRLGAVYHVDVGTYEVWMRFSDYMARCSKAGVSGMAAVADSGGVLKFEAKPFGKGSAYGTAKPAVCVVFSGANNSLGTAIDVYKRDALAVANGGRFPAGTFDPLKPATP
jgi:Domain of unknown function (DUF927)